MAALAVAAAAAAASSAVPVESSAGASGSSNVVTEPATAAVNQQQATTQTFVKEPVPISSLTRTKYVAPRYPRSAERRNLSGWVDIVFTVARDGTTKDVEVRGSDSGTTFDNAATKAVERWEFAPVFDNGIVVETRAGVRMMFAIE